LIVAIYEVSKSGWLPSTFHEAQWRFGDIIVLQCERKSVYARFGNLAAAAA
jgi:hypothetical protein